MKGDVFLKVTAVVVTYNRKMLLQECLDAILAQTFAVDRVLVVDNCSNDGTEDLFSEGGTYCNNLIRYEKKQRNLGGAGGFAEGIRLAINEHPDWIWVMDDDTIPKANALEELITAIEKLNGETIGFIASAVYGPNNEPMNVPAIQAKPSNNGYPDWYLHLKEGIVKIRHSTFVSILISAAAVEGVGLPIAEYFIWGDDTEYTQRIGKMYGQGYLCGSSEVIHKRFITRNIDVLSEQDGDRISQYHYYYRNTLINASFYNRKGSVLYNIARYFLLSLRCLLSGEKNGGKRFLAIQRGIIEFLFFSKTIKKRISQYLF